jgi:hypothetical protein
MLARGGGHTSRRMRVSGRSVAQVHAERVISRRVYQSLFVFAHDARIVECDTGVAHPGTPAPKRRT